MWVEGQVEALWEQKVGFEAELLGLEQEQESVVEKAAVPRLGLKSVVEEPGQGWVSGTIGVIGADLTCLGSQMLNYENLKNIKLSKTTTKVWMEKEGG